MIDLKSRSKNRRDYILLIVLFFLIGGVYFVFQSFFFGGEAQKAHIFYGSSNQPIVSIDFVKRTVTKNYSQSVPDGYDDIYPIIDLTHQKIVLLGFYSINQIRQEVVISYDFDKKSVIVIEEKSPFNICSREGESTGKPIICLPNRIRIEFEVKTEDDFII
jgi:hypothetical protein